jgi:hypothetical protein
MNIRIAAHRGLSRTGVVSLAVLASASLGISAAAAAPAVITLDSGEIYHGWGLSEMSSPRPVSTQDSSEESHAVPLAWGAAVTITVPPQYVDNGGVRATLDLGPTAEPSATTITYDSQSSTPATVLPLTPLGSNRYRIVMPADDGVNGPAGWLQMTGFDIRDGIDIQPGERTRYLLAFSAGGPAAVALAPQFLAYGYVPSVHYGVLPPSMTVSPRRSFQATLPATARLSRLGIPDLGTSVYSLRLLDANGMPTATVVALTPALSADKRTATLTVPAGIAAGTYEFETVMGDGADGVWASMKAAIEVKAGNFGLRSNTGWGETDESPADTGLSPLVPLGAGMVLTAGLGAAALARRRQSSQA